MPTYYGIVQGNVVVLPEGVQLVDGQRVEVRVPAPETAQPGTPRPEDQLEDEFEQYLVERGLLTENKNPAPIPAVGDWTPIQVKGKPLSEQIIEDRR